MTGNQRWRGRKTSFVCERARFDPARYDVAPMANPAAKAFVEAHHYSGTYPAARFRFGLFGPDGLEGAAVFSHPVNDATITNALPWVASATEGVELGRFALLDSAGFNAETWFLGHALRALKARGLKGVVSFSDPAPRTDASGRTVFVGHQGTIYKASNAVASGRGRARRLLLLPDGRAFSDRALSKLRRKAGPCRECGGCTKCTGWAYAAATLRSFGATPGHEAGWVERLTRPMKHPGNLRFVFPLGRGRR